MRQLEESQILEKSPPDIIEQLSEGAHIMTVRSIQRMQKPTTSHNETVRYMYDIMLDIVKSYNNVIKEKHNLAQAFQDSINQDKEVPKEISDAIFSSLYTFYNKSIIPQDEIDNIKTLSIANLGKPSKFKSALRTIFCCNSQDRYDKQKKVFRENIKILFASNIMSLEPINNKFDEQLEANHIEEDVPEGGLFSKMMFIKKLQSKDKSL